MTKEKFGQMPDARKVDIYTIENSNGIQMKVTNYGAILVSLTAPDKEGNFDDIVLGYNDLKSYLEENPYFGAIVGRYGNRIDKGRFSLNGKEYQLTINDGENHLHGGKKGFDKVLWKADEIKNGEEAGVEFSYTSRDGEQGYPGKLTVSVKYLLNEANEMKLVYEGKADKPTIINLTHHSYFNLAGEGNPSILDHKLKIRADNFTPIDSNLIPTGEIRPVKNTPMDFRELKRIGKDINANYKQLQYAGGYDHNWILNRKDEGLIKVATLAEDSTGRLMEIYTTEPGLQFYSGNFLDGTIIGKSGQPYKYRSALCLETQHFPDSPNHPNFPSTILRPGEKYRSQTIYKFLTK